MPTPAEVIPMPARNANESPLGRDLQDAAQEWLAERFARCETVGKYPRDASGTILIDAR
jgi:hypothetical protein